MYNKVLAVIVTYKPDKELLTKNIDLGEFSGNRY